MATGQSGNVGAICAGFVLVDVCLYPHAAYCNTKTPFPVNSATLRSARAACHLPPIAFNSSPRSVSDNPANAALSSATDNRAGRSPREGVATFALVSGSACAVPINGNAAGG